MPKSVGSNGETVFRLKGERAFEVDVWTFNRRCRLLRPHGFWCFHGLRVRTRFVQKCTVRDERQTLVQYGLRALNAGVIGVAQFLDLNERVGGYDGDGRFSARGQGLGDPSFMKDRSESCED